VPSQKVGRSLGSKIISYKEWQEFGKWQELESTVSDIQRP
jgi:hypothetical protein